MKILWKCHYIILQLEHIVASMSPTSFLFQSQRCCNLMSLVLTYKTRSFTQLIWLWQKTTIAFTSGCSICHPYCDASPTAIFSISRFIVGGNVSSKSTPFYCSKPLAINLTFSFFNIPFILTSVLYTHLLVVGLFPSSNSTSYHILFFVMDSILLFHGLLPTWVQVATSLYVVGYSSMEQMYSFMCIGGPLIHFNSFDIHH